MFAVDHTEKMFRVNRYIIFPLVLVRQKPNFSLLLLRYINQSEFSGNAGTTAPFNLTFDHLELETQTHYEIG